MYIASLKPVFLGVPVTMYTDPSISQQCDYRAHCGILDAKLHCKDVGGFNGLFSSHAH
jgi:hypothetical protein